MKCFRTTNGTYISADTVQSFGFEYMYGSHAVVKIKTTSTTYVVATNDSVKNYDEYEGWKTFIEPQILRILGWEYEPIITDFSPKNVELMYTKEPNG